MNCPAVEAVTQVEAWQEEIKHLEAKIQARKELIRHEIEAWPGVEA